MQTLEVKVEPTTVADGVAVAIGPNAIISENAQQFVIAQLDWLPFALEPNTVEARERIANELRRIIVELTAREILQWSDGNGRWRVIL